MRLIDADSICKGCPSYEDCKGECWSEGECEIYDVLIKAPTIDAVPVVRCKDCAFQGHFKCPMDEWVKPDENGFCHYGKRKDGDG